MFQAFRVLSGFFLCLGLLGCEDAAHVNAQKQSSALSIFSCSTFSPGDTLSPGKTLDGYPAKDIRIVVTEPYSFTPGLVAHTLPVGIYTPVKYDDDDGVYFQSPNKISISDFPVAELGHTLINGGLLFKGGVSADVYEYIGKSCTAEFKLPNDFKFRIEKKP
jgi:hypothetical protein